MIKLPHLASKETHNKTQLKFLLIKIPAAYSSSNTQLKILHCLYFSVFEELKVMKRKAMTTTRVRRKMASVSNVILHDLFGKVAYST